MTSKYSTKIKPLDDGIAMGMSGANMAIKQVDVFRGQLSGAQVKLRTSSRARRRPGLGLGVAAWGVGRGTHPG